MKGSDHTASISSAEDAQHIEGFESENRNVEITEVGGKQAFKQLGGECHDYQAQTQLARPFDDIVTATTLQAEDLCRHLFPDGRRKGRGWFVKAYGESGQSLNITVAGKRAGNWSGKGMGPGEGNDLVDLWSHTRGVNRDEAAATIAAWLESQAATTSAHKVRGKERTARCVSISPHSAESKVAETAVVASPRPSSTPFALKETRDKASTAVSESRGVLLDGGTEVEDFRVDSVEKHQGAQSADCNMPLTAAEAAEYESKIRRLKVLQGAWFETMNILREIRDRRLYRGEFQTFEVFCRESLSMGKSNLNRMIRSGDVAHLLATNVAKPECEAHIRPLLRLEDAAQQVQAYQNAVNRAKSDDKPLTATHVVRAVREIRTAQQAPADPTTPLPSKGTLMTLISRAMTRDLEKLSLEQLQDFKDACLEFKTRWLANQPPEPPPEEDLEPTEAHEC